MSFFHRTLRSGSVRARRAASKLLNSPDKSPPEQPQKSGTKKNSVSEKTLKSSSKKTITKITPESKVEKNTTSLPKKVYKPSFHMSQTQGVETVLPSYNRSSPRQDGGPLRGFSKFICWY